MDKKNLDTLVKQLRPNEARQLDSVYALGIDESDIDKQSRKDFIRTQYPALKLRLRKGGTLYIH